MASSTTRLEAPAASAGVHFSAQGAFHAELKRSVARYFATSGQSQHGGIGMWLKTAIILAWAAGSYVLLLQDGVASWERALLAVSMGLAMAAIGFNVMHDANHGSYARGRRANRVLGFTLDLIGGSSFLWRHKHNVLHHTYTNIVGVDVDLGANPLLRFAPDQPRRPIMRYQHLYVWLLYAVYPLGWWLVDDFRKLATGKMDGGPFPRPHAADLALALLGKVVFLGWAVALPLALHPTWRVLPWMALTTATLGLTLATTFQLAHCVGQADFHDGRAGLRIADWATHQVTTTVDFARGNRLLCWYLGGLNFQVEHHLFPKICHLHYPALSRIVEATCAAHGVRYTAQPSLRAAVVANVRWLRRLGRGEEGPARRSSGAGLA
jgi:linoleoyl-CoA desaturase